MTKKEAAEKAARKEKIEQVEADIKKKITEIVPEVEALSPEAVDDGLIQAFDIALESAHSRMDEAKANGKVKKG